MIRVSSKGSFRGHEMPVLAEGTYEYGSNAGNTSWVVVGVTTQQQWDLAHLGNPGDWLASLTKGGERMYVRTLPRDLTMAERKIAECDAIGDDPVARQLFFSELQRNVTL